MSNKSNYNEEMTATAIVVGMAMGEILEEKENSYAKSFLSNIGLMACYDIGLEVSKRFIEAFPLDFDWEAHYSNGGEDWDMEVRAFTKKHIADNHKPISEH
ncbi:hypothetical protein AWW68_19415 [Roseivirga spongicola]|uniref:Uncharacterized protein n=1 Tax=Roseivirga spongicola TaxID=333140 RepID=A0A150XCF8_9BACT|nr:hypothetical protein [Roseivirga spongicola]KYG76417.1 hypothetical protein AWW68_19415 [Roseivirga spongicola]